MKLYELTAQYQAIKEMDLDADVMQDTLEALEGSIEQKADNITKLMKELTASSDAKKAEAKRLLESSAADERKEHALKEYLRFSLTQAGINKLDTGLFKIGFRKGSEVVKVDEDKLPSHETNPEYYVWQDPKPIGKTELKKLLKDGAEIPGVSLVRNPDTLQIK